MNVWWLDSWLAFFLGGGVACLFARVWLVGGLAGGWLIDYLVKCIRPIACSSADSFIPFSWETNRHCS